MRVHRDAKTTPKMRHLLIERVTRHGSTALTLGDEARGAELIDERMIHRTEVFRTSRKNLGTESNAKHDACRETKSPTD